MLMWLLPTFLWTGQELDESDRPFQNLKLSEDRYDRYGFYNHIPTPVQQNLIDNRHRTNQKHFLKKTKPIPLSKRLATVVETVTTQTSFSRVYNSLFCPQCIARIGLINGVVVRKLNQFH